MVNIIKRKVRSNGFECPLHPTQAFTYFLFVSDMISYFAIDMVSLSYNTPLTICLSLIYIILAIGTTYYGYVSTSINPSDPTISLEK